MKEESRHPIVTFVGHVNHGKTTLIEKICKKSILKKEYGDITQNIETYFITTSYGNLTILDTPGHEAFLNMRIRGINCTDIVILVIAADDGIMEQTKEIISYVKKENLPLIIVINKIDRTKKNIEKIVAELSKHNIIDEKWGGDTFFVQTSAKLNIGVNKLIETIYLQAEFLELKKNEKDPAEGIIIETQIDKGYGKLSNIILLKGKLKKKDLIKIENNYEQIKLILDLNKKEIKELYAAIPAYIIGLHNIPRSGEKLYKAEQKKHLKKNIFVKHIYNEKCIRNTTIDDKIVNVILKSNTFGSAEALVESIKKIQYNDYKIEVKSVGTGNIYKSDIENAIAFNAILIGLNITCESNLLKIAQNDNIVIKLYNVIYVLLKDIETLLKEKSQKNEIINIIIGVAKVKTIFILSNKDIVYGCTVLTGVIRLNDTIEIKRDDTNILKTAIKSLQQYKHKIKEIKKGEDCGIILSHRKEKIQINDTISVYKKFKKIKMEDD